MENKLTRTASNVFLEEYPSDSFEHIKSATELWFVGVSLNRTIKEHFHTIEQKIQRGTIVKILIVNPDSAAVEAVRSRGRFPISIDQMRNSIVNTLEELSHLKTVAPDKLEIRTIMYPISFGAIITNPNDSDTTSGILMLEHYPYRIKRTSVPKFFLTAKRDAEWYNLYKSELESLWNDAKEWQYSTKNP